MSYRIYSLICKHCNKEYNNLYISFGHPEKPFDWKWKCKECNEENTEKIPAMFNARMGMDINR